MKTKKLYVVVQDCGDGSFYPRFTFNEEWIDRMSEADYGEIGVDGDGFHYETLTVPESCTLESLGIRMDIAQEDDDEEE